MSVELLLLCLMMREKKKKKILSLQFLMQLPELDNDLKCGLDGFTPLHTATKDTNLEMVKLLLELGASIDEKSKVAKQTPLGLAAELGESEVRQGYSSKCSLFSFILSKIAKYLLGKGADKDGKDGYDEELNMMYAVRSRNKDVVKVLLEAGAEYDPKYSSVTTPFYLACEKGLLDIVKMFYK